MQRKNIVLVSLSVASVIAVVVITVSVLFSSNDRDAGKSAIQDLKGKAVAELMEIAKSTSFSDRLRAQAIQMLAESSDKESLNTLIDVSHQEGSPVLRAFSLQSLGQRSEPESEKRLQEVASDRSDPANAMALSLLGSTSSEKSKEILVDTIKSLDPLENLEEVNAALYSLRFFNDDKTIDLLMIYANDINLPSRIRATALYALGEIGNEKAIDIVKDNMLSSEREIAYSAVHASTNIHDDRIILGLIEAVADNSQYPHVREEAASSLSLKDLSSEKLDLLLEKIHQTDGHGVFLISKVFKFSKYKGSIPTLKEIMRKTQDKYLIYELSNTITLLEEEK